jgi:uncharacterized repeat protein (TIGR02543 family)
VELRHGHRYRQPHAVRPLDAYLHRYVRPERSARPGPTHPAVLSGGTITEPTTAPQWAGYKFEGWYTTKSSGGYRYTFDGNDPPVTSNLPLDARWTPIYTVTFDLNGAPGQAPTHPAVLSGGTITEPMSAPQRTGYTFGGWFTEAACTTQWDFNNTITANRTLYAKWSQITYTVTFNLNYSGAPAGQTQTVAHGATASAPDPAPPRGGYTLDGWFTEAACTTQWNFNNTITANRTLYAKWTKVTYTITMNKNGGTWNYNVPPLQDSYELDYGTLFTPSQNIYMPVHYFRGWYYDAALTNNIGISITVTENITIYAKWESWY